MYNYHSNLIWRIDIALAAVSVALTITIIIYSFFNNLIWNRRKGALLKIKRNIFELLLSEKTIDKNTCLPIAEDLTLQQFLDIQSNRDREAVFFNDEEQKLFKKCFVSTERIKKFEDIAIKPGNKWRRIEAIMCLGYSESPSVLKTIKTTIDSRDRDISYASILALGQVRTVESAKILLSFLKKNPSDRYKIVSLLENFPRKISDDVVKLTEDDDPSVRLWTLRLLSKLKNIDNLAGIEKLTSDDSPEVRAAACECLGATGNKEARVILQKCLADSEWLVRSSAVMALSRILGDDCIPLVIGKINDGSLTVIDAVKKAIAEHAEPAIPYILKIFEGEDEFSKKVCLEALESSDSELAAATVKKLKGEAS